MKKLVLMMVGLFLIGGTALAQDKEALKAEKEARKAAESTFKKARSTYEMSIPNQQYGRKETDFSRLDTALPLIEEAMTNEYTKNEAPTWKVAADIYQEYYKVQENAVKADPDNDQTKKQFIETASKLLNACVKYDSLLNLNPKMKADEKKAQHTQYQNMAVNPAGQLLQATQNFSNSESQEDLKLATKYAEQFLNAMNSSLMADFKNDRINIEDWKSYAKAFRAQAYKGLPDTPEETIVAVYEEMMQTNYKPVAYSALISYYSDKDNTAKVCKYLDEAIDALKGNDEWKDTRSQFAFMLMQRQFQGGDKEGFRKTIQLIKAEFADNENAVNAYLMEGQMAFEDKEYDKAKGIFLEAKDKYPNESRCLLMAARSAWMKAQVGGSKKPDMDEAIKLFKQLEAENPSDPEMWGEALYILYNNTQQMNLAAQYKKYYKAN